MGKEKTMPKIIDNLKGKILGEAKNQLLTAGYAKMTIRSVAAACKISVGTIYNYFDSKDMVIATILLEDWNSLCKSMESGSAAAKTPMELLGVIHSHLDSFTDAYAPLFGDKSAQNSYMKSFAVHHGTLRKQIAGLIAPHCEGGDMFTAEFIAEALLDRLGDNPVDAKRMDRLLCRLF